MALYIMKVPDVHSQGEKINSPIWRVEFDIYSPVASSQAFFATPDYIVYLDTTQYVK